MIFDFFQNVKKSRVTTDWAANPEKNGQIDSFSGPFLLLNQEFNSVHPNTNVLIWSATRKKEQKIEFLISTLSQDSNLRFSCHCEVWAGEK